VYNYDNYNYELEVSVYKDKKATGEKHVYRFLVEEDRGYGGTASIDQEDNYTRYLQQDNGHSYYLSKEITKGDSVSLYADPVANEQYTIKKDWYKIIKVEGEPDYLYYKAKLDADGKREKVTYQYGGIAPDASEYDEAEYDVNYSMGEYEYGYVRFLKKVTPDEDGIVTLDGEDIAGTYWCKITLSGTETEGKKQVEKVLQEQTVEYNITYADDEEPVEPEEPKVDTKLTAYAKDDAVSALIGEKVTLMVSACNIGELDGTKYPITYKWEKLDKQQKKYVTLDKITTESYTIDSLTKEDCTDYRITVSDGNNEDITLSITVAEKVPGVTCLTPAYTEFTRNVREEVTMSVDLVFDENVTHSEPVYTWSKSYTTQSAQFVNTELTDVDGNSYTFDVMEEDYNAYYTCKVQYTLDGTRYDQTFNFRVVKPSYTTELQALSKTFYNRKEGESVAFSARLVSNDPAIDESDVQYQWEKLVPVESEEDEDSVDTEEWQKIKGATSTYYEIESLSNESNDFTDYRLIAWITDEDDESVEIVDSLVFYVNPYSEEVYTDPSDEIVTGVLGESITLEPVIKCADQALEEKLTYQWYRGNYDDGLVEIPGAEQKSYKIESLGKNDCDPYKYQCRIYAEGSWQATYTVTIDEETSEEDVEGITAIGTTGTKQSDGTYLIKITNGQSATMKVKATTKDDRELFYQWYLGDKAIGDATTAEYTTEGIVDEVVSRRYICEITDADPNSAPKKVTFVVRPTRNLEVKNEGKTIGYETTIGGSAALSVEASVDEGFPIEYQWYKQDVIEGSRKYRTLTSETSEKLTLQNITDDDLGFYRCEVSSGSEFFTVYYNVYVNSGLVTEASNKYVTEAADGSAKMYVKARANAGQDITFHWYKGEYDADNTPDEEDELEAVTTTDKATSMNASISTLTIPTVGREDYGAYTCFVETKYDDEPVVITFNLEESCEITQNRTYAKEGEKVTFTSKITNPAKDVTYSYQWYTYDVKTRAEYEIEGATDASYTAVIPKVNPDAKNGYGTVSYNCRVIRTYKDENGEEQTWKPEQPLYGTVNVFHNEKYTTTLPETDHPCERYSVKAYKDSGAQQLVISFDSKTDCYGKWRSGELVLIDKNGKEIEYDGERSVTVDGDEVIFLFNTYDADDYDDGTVGNYGYKVTAIQGVRPAAPTPVTPAPPAPSEDKKDNTTGNTTQGNNAATGNNATTNTNAAAPAAPAQGTKATVGNLIFAVTVSAAQNGEAAVVGVVNKKVKSASIPDTVSIGGCTFQVTSIGAGAFKGMKKLKKVTIGKNITTIGANAFAGDKKLKKVTVKAAKLKKIAKNAFAKTKKVTIKVPKKQKKAYKKLFKKAKVK